MEFNQDTIFEIVPCPKPRMTQRDKWQNRPPVNRYRIFKSGLEVLSLQHKYSVGDTLSLTFNIPMPDSWSKKKKNEMLGQPHQSKPDLDNLIKAFKDALCKDDSHVHTYGLMKKQWSDVGSIIIHSNC